MLDNKQLNDSNVGAWGDGATWLFSLFFILASCDKPLSINDLTEKLTNKEINNNIKQIIDNIDPQEGISEEQKNQIVNILGIKL